MEYIIRLYRKNHATHPFTRKELAVLQKEFTITFTGDQDDGDIVHGFTISRIHESPDHSFEYYQQRDGSYATAIPLESKSEHHDRFGGMVRDVAIGLDMQILDIQISNELIHPEDYFTNSVPPNAPYMLPAKHRHFIKYVISSHKPQTYQRVYLRPKDGGIIGTKINPGQTLVEILDKEVPELLGSPTYTLTHVTEQYDVARDRFGNEVSRAAVYIEVPYFDPETTATQFPVQWVEVVLPKTHTPPQKDEEKTSTPQEEPPVKKEFLAIQEHHEDQLRLYNAQYESAKSMLTEKFPTHYIASFKAYADKHGKIVTMSTWANFIPTIVPETDYVMLGLFRVEGTRRISPIRHYVIEQQKLFSLLTDEVESIFFPINSYALHGIESKRMQQEIIAASDFVSEEE